MGGTKEKQLGGLQKIRKLTSVENNPPIQAVIESSGLLTRIIELLDHEDDGIKFEAAWVLTNLAFGSSVQTREIIQAGVLPPLIKLINSANESPQEQAVWAIANIAGDSAELRNIVLEAGALSPILEYNYFR